MFVRQVGRAVATLNPEAKEAKRKVIKGKGMLAPLPVSHVATPPLTSPCP